MAAQGQERAQNRWGSGVRRDDPDDACEALLDAASQCFRRLGVEATRMDDIAREARVSRPTVYKYFSSREAIVLAVVVARTQLLYADLEALIAAERSVADTIIEIVMRSVTAMRADEVLARMYAADAHSALESVSTSAEWALDVQRLFRPLVRRGQQTRELGTGVRARDLAEWVLRLIAGLLFTQTAVSQDPAAERRLLRAFVH